MCARWPHVSTGLVVIFKQSMLSPRDRPTTRFTGRPRDLSHQIWCVKAPAEVPKQQQRRRQGRTTNANSYWPIICPNWFISTDTRTKGANSRLFADLQRCHFQIVAQARCALINHIHTCICCKCLDISNRAQMKSSLSLTLFNTSHSRGQPLSTSQFSLFTRTS